MIKELVVSKELLELATALSNLGEQLYVVGGYVRNSLLGVSTTDVDIAGTAKQETVLEVCNRLGYHASVISSKMGTIVIKHKEQQFEYTTFRVETYPQSGNHSPDTVEFVTDVEADSRRRDFTVNALYYDILHHEIRDYVNGLADINTRTLRCIGNPQSVFENDGLRILRFIRFGLELNLNFDKASYKSAKAYVGNLADISKVRMLKELKDILNSDSKYATYQNQLKKAIAMFNDFGIYGYLFNQSFASFRFKPNKKLWKAFLQTTKQNRYYVFMVLVMLQFLGNKTTTVANVHFLATTLLGVNGLQESNENINKIVNLYLFFQNFWFLKPISNDMCLKFNELGDVTKQFFERVNPTKVNQLNKRTERIGSKNIPFKIGDLNVQNSELLENGIHNKLIGKIKVVLFNECLNENLTNEKSVLLEYAKLLNQKLR